MTKTEAVPRFHVLHRWTRWDEPKSYSIFQYRHCVKCGKIVGRRAV